MIHNRLSKKDAAGRKPASEAAAAVHLMSSSFADAHMPGAMLKILFVVS